MIKLTTDHTYKFGKVNILPILGETQISEDGTIEVESKEIADQIESLEIGFYILDEAPEEEEEEDDLNEEEEDLGEKSETPDLIGKEEPATEQVSSESTKEAELKSMIEALTLKTKAELTELAKPFPGNEWRALNKEELIKYIASKL